MKSIITLLGVAACGLLTVNTVAQSTAFTYQGRLNSSGSPANGVYDFRFRLASDPFGNEYVGSALLTNAVPVSNGLFTATLDFGTGVFTGSNYWLEVDVRTNGGGSYSVLTPLQAFTRTPYAIFAGTASNLSGTISAAQIGGTIANNNLPGSPNFSGAVSAGSFAGNGANITNVNAATLNGLDAASFWKTAGNSGTGNNNFVGTSDNQPLEFRVNDGRVLRLEPGGPSARLNNGIPTGAPNTIGGSSTNSVAAGVVGAVIGGGGATNYAGFAYANTVGGDFGIIGGGISNAIVGNAIYSTIGGGGVNAIHTNANWATIGGGGYNLIQSGSSQATIGGGGGNIVQSNAGGAVIAGGSFNSILANASGAMAIGGFGNTNAGLNSIIVGGVKNLVQAGAVESVISGGDFNVIQSNAVTAVIGGGSNNIVQLSTSFATIGGGALNTNGGYATTISGGMMNTIQTNTYSSTIGGGYNQTIQSNTYSGTIAGGNANMIQAGTYFSTIGGGAQNTIQTNSMYAVIPGGNKNVAGYNYSFAAGYNAYATNIGAFVWSDGSNTATGSTNNNSVTMRASGGFRFLTSTGTAGAQLAPNATSWSVLSDRNAKKNISLLDCESVLNKLTAVPIQQWNYNWEQDGEVPNFGPMAQDFKAAFYPGRDDKSISTLEFDGVELAAIQGLNQKLNKKLAEKDAQIEALRKQNTALEERLDMLQRAVESVVTGNK